MLVWLFALLLQRPVTSGTVITRTVTLPAGVHVVASPDIDHPAITIRGSNLTVDFSGVTLQGGRSGHRSRHVHRRRGPRRRRRERHDQEPARARLQDRRPRAAVDAAPHHRRGPQLQLEAAALQPRRARKPASTGCRITTTRRTSGSTRGAGIYLADSDDGGDRSHHDRAGPERPDARALEQRARSGTTPSRSSRASASALYRASGNTIMHNRVDWCVRGYSHGFYNRGQDSAGILIYEQSSRNIVAFNSVTHGGDGLFLWAGQSTMDTGQGGANDNVFYDNDFSFAPTNGIEATFSRNVLLRQPRRGVLARPVGRLQLRLVDAAPTASRSNTEAIAIEHGQDNRITENTFDGDETAIRLWKNATPGSELGIPEAARHAQPRLRHRRQHLRRQHDGAEDHRDAERPRSDQRLREGRDGRGRSPATRATSASATR